MSMTARTVDEVLEPSEVVPDAYFSRGHYMENLVFPKNSPSLVVIPSNSKGTGFIKSCYDPRFLKGIMSE